MTDCFVVAESSSVELLRDYIDTFLGTTLVGYSYVMPENLNGILAFKPDIIFIESSFVQGDDAFISRIRQVSNVIFISKNKDEAYDAFEYLAFDCLVMPFTFSRFEKSINKFDHWRRLIQLRLSQKSGIENTFLIKTDSKGLKKVVVKCDELLYISALQNYVVLKMTNGEQLVCYHTMKEMECSLAEFNFIRIHKSYLISSSKISSLDSRSIWLGEREPVKISIGNTYKTSFFEKMKLNGIKTIMTQEKSIKLSKNVYA